MHQLESKPMVKVYYISPSSSSLDSQVGSEVEIDSVSKLSKFEKIIAVLEIPGSVVIREYLRAS